MSVVSDTLRIILYELNISQTDFAGELGISFNYVNMILTGKRYTISGHLAKLIETVYGYSAHWILSGRGEKMAGAMDRNSPFMARMEKQVKNLSSGELDLVSDFISFCETQTARERDKRALKKQRKPLLEEK
jgi:transcriptional regulator with XRE-family HTH domain